MSLQEPRGVWRQREPGCRHRRSTPTPAVSLQPPVVRESWEGAPAARSAVRFAAAPVTSWLTMYQIVSGPHQLAPSGDQLLSILSVLANPQRLRIMAALAANGRNYISQHAREVGIGRPLLHLQKLEALGLLTSARGLLRRQGTQLLRCRRFRDRARSGCPGAGGRHPRRVHPPHRIMKADRMSERLYLITLALPFGTVLVIFAMRCLAAARQAHARILSADAYRSFAEHAAAT